MAEKVITLNIQAGTAKGQSLEIDMKPVNDVLDKGYTVKQVVPIPFHSNSTLGFTTIVFVLEKRTGGGTQM